MPRLTPFRGIRYATADLAAVTAPPYDVLSDAERAALANRHPHNIVHVDVPLEEDGPERYERAAALVRRWQADQVLSTDPAPALYLYRLTFADEAGVTRGMTGVLGGLDVQEAGPAADVLPHEQTTPKATTDRLDLTHATGINLSPVWGLSLATGLHDLLDPAATPLGSFVDGGVTHTLERIDDAERVDAIARAVGAAPVVIADGHHRYDVARTFRREQRARLGHPGPYDETLAFVVELVDHQLHVQAIHRLLSEVDGDLPTHLGRCFHLVEAGPVSTSVLPELEARGALCLVHPDGSGTFLVPRPDAFPGVADLDSARLSHALAGLPHEVRYQHGVERILAAVAGGEATWGVLLRPVGVAAIEATAEQRVLMPPKSTFFWPKLRTGLVLRSAVS